MTEKEKMLSGALYDPLDEQLTNERHEARLLFQEFNNIPDSEKEKRKSLLKKLLPNAGEDLWIEPPFYCDYGSNIYLGDKVFLNFNCVMLDVATISIGSRTLIAPNVQFYAATHPLDHKVRASGLENGKAIIIGEDVWIGGGVIICPGVTIGDRAVIGAGSVVVKDIPSDVLAVGNPCRVVRELF